MNRRQTEGMERLAERLDLPAELVAGVTRVDITGERTVYVENHRGLLEYGGECIRLRGCGVEVRVRGSGLQIRTMTGRELNLTGHVAAVEFLREEQV